MQIAKSTIQFLRDIDVHNNRDWFNTNKEAYQAALDNFTQFVDSLITHISRFDARMKHHEAKDAIFRIYRDTRFSKDKTPYKTYFGASLMGRGSGVMEAGYYLHLKPEGSFLAGGLHMPDAGTLQKVRMAISSRSAAFHKIIAAKAFKENFTIEGEQLARVPKGFSKDDPMAEYLRHKDLLIIHPLEIQTIVAVDFMQHCLKVCRAMVPFNAFISEAKAGGL